MMVAFLSFKNAPSKIYSIFSITFNVNKMVSTMCAYIGSQTVNLRHLLK